MTKNLFALLCLICCVQLSFANKVDDLKTDKDVLNFIKSVDTVRINPKYSGNMTLPSTEDILKNKNCNPMASSWGVKNWVKADFNNDGRTDLLVTVNWENSYDNFIAIDKGNNTFQLINLNYSSFNHCELVNVIKIHHRQLVVFHGQKSIPVVPESMLRKKVFEDDTLIYHSGGFVEYNPHPSHYDIDSITYSSGACYGPCPTLTITIDKFGNATYNAGSYSENVGIFKAVIKKDDIDSIYALINYLSIKNLKDNYAVNWTDSPTCSIKIKFKNGTKKNISDYGEEGTFGLQTLYSELFKLTTNQNWIAEK